jgi:hypothetical protein
MLGQRIGQYRVVERLGAGGMGSVYRAVDETLGRDVALKVIDTSMEGSRARLRAEAAAMARLSHPGIATVHELIEEDDRLVLVMELVRGQTLQQILEQVGVFSPRRAAELCMQALAALQHAHASGVVHRDLKPGNLMLGESGTIAIMDFGIARLEGTLNLTNAGAMLGTPAYMAPEQVLGHPVDLRADLYAMGIVFFRLVTAALPFKGDTPFEVAQAQVNEAPPTATSLRPELPPWVDALLGRALAKKPADRFQSAMEFHEAFARSIAGAPALVATPIAEKTEMLARPFPAPQPAAGTSVVRATQQLRRVWPTAAALVVIALAIWIRSATSGAAQPADTPSSGIVQPAADAAALPEPSPATEVPSARPATSNVSLTRAINPAPAAVSPAATTTSAADSSRTPASFDDVKVLEVNGSRTATSDAVVQFSDAQVSVHPADVHAAAVVLSYHDIAKATYVQARDPKWDAALSGPTEKINLPGIFGRPRHWLVLQGANRYLILRLDGDDRAAVMKAFEERAGVPINRPTTTK